ncbi:hypothetical protein BASA81_010144 [Batrachochytrium salamandrivorans]|nr:hypothetical protein BASA81_010144 [Batrachochytrium salamandrivorans]
MNFKLLVLLSAALAGVAAWWFSDLPPTHAEGVEVADYGRKDLPPLLIHTRVIRLISGLHFDHLLQDTPDELRPPAVVLFTGFESCDQSNGGFAWFDTLAETELPARERLLVASYDLDASPVRAWYRFTPEMDLAKRFGVTQCGTLVFVPQTCDGNTEYCIQPAKPGDSPDIQRVGCGNFTDLCGPNVVTRLPLTTTTTPKQVLEWIRQQIKTQREPLISPVFGSYLEQGRWIAARDDSTSDNLLRNLYLAESFPAFTPLGFAASPAPAAFTEWMRGFWTRRVAGKRKEYWDAQSSLISFHETPTTFVDLDLEGPGRDKLANEVIKPLVEKWSGISPLELTAFYGIRIYEDNFLRPHVDRIDTHVLSVTFSLGKLDPNDPNRWLTPEEEAKLPAWPLEVVGFDGEIYRHRHAGGVQILYESSKLIHGRPYYNRGPPHVGAFMHFKPVNLNASQTQQWEQITRKARGNFNSNHRMGRYRATASVEPTTPKFTTSRIGDHTGFQREADRKLANQQRQNERVVWFENTLDRPLDLHWVQGKAKEPKSGDLVLQAQVLPHGKQEMSTFVGHRFAWTEVGKKTVLPKGLSEIEVGRNPHYKYP